MCLGSAVLLAATVWLENHIWAGRWRGSGHYWHAQGQDLTRSGNLHEWTAPRQVPRGARQRQRWCSRKNQRKNQRLAWPQNPTSKPPLNESPPIFLWSETPQLSDTWNHQGQGKSQSKLEQSSAGILAKKAWPPTKTNRAWIVGVLPVRNYRNRFNRGIRFDVFNLHRKIIASYICPRKQQSAVFPPGDLLDKRVQ